MAKHDYRPQPHKYAGDLDVCTSCQTGPNNPLHLLSHPFNPGAMRVGHDKDSYLTGGDDSRDVPEYCRCGLPERHRLHADPRPRWARPRELEPEELEPADRVPALLSDAWAVPE